ncbi:hypothetical protein GLOTRDRAFT_132327 [Gloeophyllum trabeum ATCC 11539]|uniref:Uncharacterized protein n=1 Tax=Gloeophyllum trabeum (strain ATCC 11539 / FP-39264 / Madison 617) TaxID=670483 RepID=S7RHY2_GLOTA|nr:uncharacterized protein GLOTRDRAFT_132327 [Gloeophyllum trabeum ATCC 11539]EPQ52209.1 hypothetical protein GLOTRDRAFT_132327 [Gloeophyllum trabeum ATCC 11539]
MTSPDSPLASPPASPTTATSNTKRLSVGDVAHLFLKLRPQAHGPSITSSSGPEPHTDAALRDDAGVRAKRLPLAHAETFVCAGAVDVPKLLRASRAALLERVGSLGANCLVDERWTCTIHPTSKSGSHGTYKVHITYEACAARTSRRDPGKPPALDKAKGVPGLMTILERQQ